MPGTINSPEVIERVLTQKPRIVVVGLSPKPQRPSNDVASFLLDRGFEVVPVNPRATKVLGRLCYSSLEEVPGEIEVVDVFRRGEELGPIVDAAIARGAKVVWLQLGVENEEATRRAVEAGIDVVENLCIKVAILKHEGSVGPG